MNPANYSFLKSKVFWSVVLLFLYNGYAAISGQLPADVTVIVNAIFGILLPLFHIQAVNAAAVSSATLGSASSGQ